MNKSVAQRAVAADVVQTLRDRGHIALFAGGCVRDELLGRTPKDYDVATDAFPEEVERIFPKTVPIGKAFGVIAVIRDHQTIEVATFREEIGTLDGRHPETITFSAAKEDALRRDFTINGMFYDPVHDELHDYVHGRRDLKRRLIVAIGNPEERFREDHLRMLRAVRFAHTLDFEIESETEKAIQAMAPLIRNISAERIELELTRTLTESNKAGRALKHLHKLGLMQQILPELVPMDGQEQPPQFHPEGDVFEHTCLMLDAMNEIPQTEAFTRRELAYSVLLHDVGKPPTASIGPGTDGKSRIRFDGHAAVGARMAEDILIRLKFPNVEKKRIITAVAGHMRFMDVRNMKASTLRKMIGADPFELEMALHRLDCLGSHCMLENYDFVRAYQEKMANEPILPKPLINGRDVMNLGIAEGRTVGRILKAVYNAQMEDQVRNREEALAWIREKYL
ncbi:CCA tRNA nucleotidyltransferase [Pontiella agarivorans]|uniref:CCA tRNA nucleotidyltransferase n=1 Tax=Pontiella agarivorans TaxID=3038953 RepID=A0ABU5MZV5_9BACT|nr:CCA tRNA nucleotidyltransferase [Pontiella agarivorans]MDZ8119730.1 CCA tRNA nucleotidyltransferase [Pontiella agarivorans]